MGRVSLLVIALLVPSPLLAAEVLKAGAAKVDITPPTGHAMWGYAARHDAPSIGVIAPLQARALVLAVGDSRIALVSLDLGRAPTRESTATIRKNVLAAGVTEIFLVGSHTHHGPVIELDDWPTPETSYVRSLEKKLTHVILEANKHLQEARLAVALHVVPFNRNRHSKRDDKPTDNELLILKVEALDGTTIAHAVNFAAHPTMTAARNLRFSPDFVGPLCDVVEKKTGAPCLFLQGAAGDMSPNPPTQEGEGNPEVFGRQFGEKINEYIASMKAVRPKKATLVHHRESFQFHSTLDITNPLVQFALGRAFYPGLVTAYVREYKEGVRPELVTALLNDEIGFVGGSGEFFCEHSLNLKRRARLPYLFFLGYCNDYHQYFPTIQAVSEGGYGTQPPVATAELGAGEKMMDRALLSLYRLQGLIVDE